MIVYTGICFLLMIFGTFVLIPPLNVLFEWDADEQKMALRSRGASTARPRSTSYRGFATMSVKYVSVLFKVEYFLHVYNTSHVIFLTFTVLIL